MSAASRYLPVFFDLRGARALVIGAGTVAARKIDALLARGAVVTVVARRVLQPVAERARRGEIAVREGTFRASDLAKAAIVFAATSDARANARVAREARRRGIPVNVADAAADCSFIMPAVVAHDEFTVAVSTGGKNPGAARAIREYLEERRAEIAVRLERGRRRKEIAARRGKVYIVGAGPGDPDLLTVRALGLLRSADAIIHDYLVPEEILSLAPARARKICYARRGKTAGHGSALKQAAIHDAMVRLARQGKSVVRLKSGDPMVFGRGGEEAEHLARNGVPFEIVPGITAAVGCAAAAAIPLTQRGLSSSVTFLAGHEADGNGEGTIAWDRLPQKGTIAIYMGVARAAAVADELVRAGFAADTPIAVVENGTRPDQRVFRAYLGGLSRLAADAGIRSPAILFVGRSAVPLSAETTVEDFDGSVAQGV